MTLASHVRSMQKTALMIYLALFASLAIYVVVAFVVMDGDAQIESVAEPLPMALGFAAFCSGTASILVPRLLRSDAMLRRVLDAAPNLERLATGADGRTDPDRLRALQSLDDSSLRLLAISQRWMPTQILGCALAESVAICGLVLALITHQPKQIVPFAIAAAGLMANHFPRLPALIAHARELMHRR